jgi:hypothetical protein
MRKEANLKEKQCVTCEEIKPIKEFGIHLYNKDGYNTNCRECCKIKDHTRRQIDKDNNIRYQCENCDKSYSRKDTYSKHKKNCQKVDK